MEIDRRSVVVGSSVLLLGGARPQTSHHVYSGAVKLPPGGPEQLDARVGAIAAEQKLAGGRIGFAALDTATGRNFGWRGDEHYAMCSTFKLSLVAAVFAEVDAERRRLTDPIAFTEADILDYAPVVRAHATERALPIGLLAEAAVVVSDNSAANLLLPLIGGPAGLTRFFRAQGDAVSRLDRTEPTLNTNLPGDPRDITTPAAMIGTMRRILLGNALSPASRARLIGWMRDARTGLPRLRAGLPAGWTAGDKSGTGERGAAGDVAIAWPPGRAPILIAAYVDAPDAPPPERDAAHASVAALIARRFA